jgi:hypothetical protein
MLPRLSGRVALVVVVLATLIGARAGSAETRADADHTEAYFPAADGVTMLHADILRPKGMAASEKTPVILTVSPYMNHSGSTTEFELSGSGANPRFFDFLTLSGALTKGYTYVTVDLPGTGGSGGCNDWGGAREQLAVRSAVGWAASQSWSTGKVALFGKSYDGWTGLMGVAQQPVGLAAVVSMEPVYAGYRYKYMNGVRRPNFATTMALFQAIDAKPGRINDSPQYHANGAPQGWCYGVNMAGTTLDDNEHGVYWDERDLLPTSAGKTTPVFLTQGFLETNTKADGAFRWWNGLSGTKNRAWFGQFDHVRGWDRYGSRFHTGRSVFVAEVMRFLDLHLKGIQPPVSDAPIAVQDARGRYRAESSWPPADSVLLETTLRSGTYADTGGGSGERPSTSEPLWSVSEPLPHDVWLSGEPVITVGVDAVPNANISANVYDIDQSGRVAMISRGVSLIRGSGSRTVSFSMYGQDWPIAAGHRIGVLVRSGDNDEFQHIATRTTVTVQSAKIGLPFLTKARTTFIDGTSTPRLEQYLAGANVFMSAQRQEDVEIPFTLPGPLS